MSYRETRNFLEKLRALGYGGTPVHMDSFRSPDFGLVAELLHWLVKSYDPMADLVLDIDTEQDRIHFIKSVALIMASKGHLMLNTKKLYGADGYAVKEMLKIATLLYEAKKALKNEDLMEDTASIVSLRFDMSKLPMSLKETRLLASDIGKQGAVLYDLLEREVELRESRTSAIAKQLDLGLIEAEIRQQTQIIHDQIQSVQQAIDNLSEDGKNLTSKIDKKKQEYDRLAKRLDSLQGVRPAFMDEYERLEAEIQKIYASYVSKFRNLAYLEHQMENQQALDRAQNQKHEASLKELQNNMLQQELGHLRDDGDVHSGMLAMTDDGSSLGMGSGGLRVASSTEDNRRRSLSRSSNSASRNSIGRSFGDVAPGSAASNMRQLSIAGDVGGAPIKVIGSMMDEEEEEEVDLPVRAASKASSVAAKTSPVKTRPGQKQPVTNANQKQPAASSRIAATTSGPAKKPLPTQRSAMIDDGGNDDSDDFAMDDDSESLMGPGGNTMSDDINDF